MNQTHLFEEEEEEEERRSRSIFLIKWIFCCADKISKHQNNWRNK
jgi:hypothetical protein